MVARHDHVVDAVIFLKWCVSIGAVFTVLGLIEKWITKRYGS